MPRLEEPPEPKPVETLEEERKRAWKAYYAEKAAREKAEEQWRFWREEAETQKAEVQEVYEAWASHATDLAGWMIGINVLRENGLDEEADWAIKLTPFSKSGHELIGLELLKAFPDFRREDFGYWVLERKETIDKMMAKGKEEGNDSVR